MNAPTSNWLDQYIWPQIHSLMLNDAYFKLMGHARDLTKKFNGPIAGLVETGYVTSQSLAIRRLCDSRKDVVSLRRLLIETKNGNQQPLLSKLDECDGVCDQVNNYIAHTANPLRRPNVDDWNLTVGQLTTAQKAVCEVAIELDRASPQPKGYVKVIPVPQFDIMEEFRPWVSDPDIQELWKFWHTHNDTVNGWII